MSGGANPFGQWQGRLGGAMGGLPGGPINSNQNEAQFPLGQGNIDINMLSSLDQSGASVNMMPGNMAGVNQNRNGPTSNLLGMSGYNMAGSGSGVGQGGMPKYASGATGMTHPGGMPMGASGAGPANEGMRNSTAGLNVSHPGLDMGMNMPGGMSGGEDQLTNMLQSLMGNNSINQYGNGQPPVSRTSSTVQRDMASKKSSMSMVGLPPQEGQLPQGPMRQRASFTVPGPSPTQGRQSHPMYPQPQPPPQANSPNMPGLMGTWSPARPMDLNTAGDMGPMGNIMPQQPSGTRPVSRATGPSRQMGMGGPLDTKPTDHFP
eukprot:Ihof_evm4s445 gene=Ihof_evmTU4s445